MTVITKFFDEAGNEVPPEQATRAEKMTVDESGMVVAHVMFKATGARAPARDGASEQGVAGV